MSWPRLRSLLESSRRVVWSAARLGRQPAFWLIVLLVASFARQQQARRFEPERDTDTVTYERVAQFESAQMTLGSLRTIGYPALLRLLEGHRGWLKPVEYGIYAVTILGFWWAVAMWLRSGWVALAAALPLLWADIVRYLPLVLPDFLSAALGLATVTAVLLVAMRWRPVLSWTILTIGVFAAYQVRPAYLFLVPLVPVLGVILRRLREGTWAQSRFGLALTAVSAGPLLGFSLLRWLVVGHFGLVSFLGYCLTGSAASFLDADRVRALPEQEQPIAEAVLAWREGRGWRPYRGSVRVDPWIRQYTPNIYRATRPPLLRDLAEHPIEAATPLMARNERFQRWSLAVLRTQPQLYLQWVGGVLVHGIRSAAGSRAVQIPFALLVISLPLLMSTGTANGTGSDGRRLLGLALLCLGYTVLKLLLLAAVAVPLPRYLAGAVLLVPSLLWAELALIWRRAVTPLRGVE